MAAADAALSAVPPQEENVRIGFRITEGPDGDHEYVLRLGPESVGLEPGASDAPVTLNMPWDVAVGVAKNEESAQRAFLDGQIRLGGDASFLLGHADSMAEADERLEVLRERTTF